MIVVPIDWQARIAWHVKTTKVSKEHMTRAPFQVLIYPYRRIHEDGFEYAVFKRADEGFWQGISGGGEDGESPLEAARREAFEEAGSHQTWTFSSWIR